ncbi:MAG: single-stranded-DNA-specific exonuclease RecJ [Candidatus Pacebacteria bacterium]|nr:single-stranded-DNA-specific exonuclease RecJ [Candidatus Paceibacterota bacterium]
MKVMSEDVLVKEILSSRGIFDEKSIEKFLSPSYEDGVHDPFLMKDMKKAVDRFLQAIDNNEKIVVYSDFDADGIPGGALFHDFLKKIGYENFSNYIPHRNDEGYGFHLEAIDKFKEDGVDLIITIDVGIVAYDEVKRAKELGMDVIVTDHHEPNGGVLEAIAVLDPKQEDCKYPFKELCGTGVAYKFIQGILVKRDFGIKSGMEKWWLDLVGLATLSDMVPLVDENRIFAHFGLVVLRKTGRPGILQACRTLNISQRHLNEDDIGFLITPRINAASRMGHPDDAFRLLTALDEVEAGVCFSHLNSINDERKGLVGSIVKEVKKKIKKREELGSVIVSGDPKWKPSVLGLVANSLVEEYKRPVFIWGNEGSGSIKGSSRSDGSISLIDLLNSVSDSLEYFGGHKMAAGFSLKKNEIHSFEEKLCGAYDSLDKISCEDINVDGEIEEPDLNDQFYKTISKLSPFGVGNPKPVFLIKNIVPTSVRTFGKQGNHVEIKFGKNRAIGFFQKIEDFSNTPEVGKKCSLIGNPEESFFAGRVEKRIRIVDVV